MKSSKARSRELEMELLSDELERMTQHLVALIQRGDYGRHAMEEKIETVRSRLWQLLSLGPYAPKSAEIPPEHQKKEGDPF